MNSPPLNRIYRKVTMRDLWSKFHSWVNANTSLPPSLKKDVSNPVGEDGMHRHQQYRTLISSIERGLNGFELSSISPENLEQQFAANEYAPEIYRFDVSNLNFTRSDTVAEFLREFINLHPFSMRIASTNRLIELYYSFDADVTGIRVRLTASCDPVDRKLNPLLPEVQWKTAQLSLINSYDYQAYVTRLAEDLDKARTLSPDNVAMYPEWSTTPKIEYRRYSSIFRDELREALRARKPNPVIIDNYRFTFDIAEASDGMFITHHIDQIDHSESDDDDITLPISPTMTGALSTALTGSTGYNGEFNYP